MTEGCFEKEAFVDVLDDSKRTLSEMPICFSVRYIARDSPLAGFEFIPFSEGWIKIGRKMIGSIFPWATHHSYFLNNNLGIVVCLTFAQFALPFDNLPRGGRVEYVAKLAPGLVVRGGNGLAVLRGTIDEIHKKTGLEYTLRKEPVVEF